MPYIKYLVRALRFQGRRLSTKLLTDGRTYGRTDGRTTTEDGQTGTTKPALCDR